PVVTAAAPAAHLAALGTLANATAFGDGNDATLSIWDTRRANQGPTRPMAELRNQPGISALALSADVRLLAVGTTAGRAALVRLPRLAHPKEISFVNPYLNTTFPTDEFGAQTTEVAQVAISHDQRVLAIGTLRLGVYLYDITDKRRPVFRARLSGPAGSVRA